MRRGIWILIFFCCMTNLMAFSISKLDFDKVIRVGKTGKEKYYIKNDNITVMRYQIRIEGNKNVKVSPSNVILKPYEKKPIIIEATGTKIGKEKYTLVIVESSLKKEKGLNIRMNYEIEQRYKVIK